MEELRAALAMLRAHLEEHECARCQDMFHELVNVMTEAIWTKPKASNEVRNKVKTKNNDKLLHG